jgi:prepilin-type processing-associated H-X9-DG protein
MKQRFALTDVIVSIALVLMIAGVAVPAVVRSPIEMRNRSKCAANLARIGEALTAYANANGGAFPRGRYDPESGKVAVYTGVDPKDKKTFGEDGPGPNDVTAAFFLLVRAQDVPVGTFVCPSTSEEEWDYGGPGKTAQDHGNFPDRNHLSYSFQNCYPTAKVAADGLRWTKDVKAGFVLAADKNYGDEGLLKLTADSPPKEISAHGNSNNHNRDGQNALYGDGHVEFCTTPFCGIEMDNIYTFGKSGKEKGGEGISGAPAHAADNVLLPADAKLPGV